MELACTALQETEAAKDDPVSVLEVRGVVDLSNAQRVRLSRGSAGLLIDLRPWKGPDQVVNLHPLRIRLRAHYRALDAIAQKLGNLRVISTQVRYDPALGLGDVIGPLQPATDKDLLRIAADEASPIVVFDETFGRLNLDRGQASCRGEALWQGQPTAIVAMTDSTLNPAPALKVLKQVWLHPREIARMAGAHVSMFGGRHTAAAVAASPHQFCDAGLYKVCADSHGNFAFFFTRDGSNKQGCFRGHISDLPISGTEQRQ